jgi:hypothetical protein
LAPLSRWEGQYGGLTPSQLFAPRGADEICNDFWRKPNRI